MAPPGAKPAKRAFVPPVVLGAHRLDAQEVRMQGSSPKSLRDPPPGYLVPLSLAVLKLCASVMTETHYSNLL